MMPEPPSTPLPSVLAPLGASGDWYDARYGADAHRPPMDTPVMLQMADGVEFVGRRIFVEDDDGGAWAWATEDEHEPKTPECWTDCVCWGRNDEGKPSEQPKSWRHLMHANEGK